MKKIINLSLLSISLISLASCSNDNAKEDAEDKKPVVKVEQVDNRDVVQVGTYTATVEPELINNISEVRIMGIKTGSKDLAIGQHI